jgi:hypothetical protein
MFMSTGQSGLTMGETEMGINAKMVVVMMSEAGMGENSIIVALNEIKPIARFNGAAYYCPTKVSRYIKKNAL